MNTYQASKGKILIVDDIHFNRIILSRILTAAGYSISQAGDAASALKMMHQERFDLVITDYMMPDMDGIAFYEKAKSSKYDDSGPVRCPPFVICTAFQSKDLLDSAVRVGFADILLKPVDRERLLNSVERFLGLTTEELTIELNGNPAVILHSLAELTKQSPVEVIKVILEEISIAEVGSDVTSLEAFRQFLQTRLFSTQ
jgi:CheY-like chemotaxis protein